MLHNLNNIPLTDIDVSNPELYRNDMQWPLFDRLRAEDPVHFCADSPFGVYWSITHFEDIKKVESQPEIFSAASRDGGISIQIDNPVASLPMFIAMDPPTHGNSAV